MTAEDIQKRILDAFPGALVEVNDISGDGQHYAAHVVHESFRNQSRVRQHQAVYAALGDSVGKELHALALSTSAPAKPHPQTR